MIKVFYGDDRVRASAEIVKFLGDEYEVIEGAELNETDLPSVFLGATLFSRERKIMIRDFLANRAVAELLKNYLNTPHEIALFEMKIDKRGVAYKDLKEKVEFLEYKLPEKDFRAVFDIYRVAKRDGKKAVAMLDEVKANEEPVQFLGLLATQALKDFGARQGVKEKRVLKELSVVDLQMKSSNVEPWLLVEGFLLRLSSI